MNEDHPDVKYWRKLEAALKEAEQPEAAQVTGEERRALCASVNQRRHKRGLPDLINDEDECPEIGLHRIAAARGLIKRSA